MKFIADNMLGTLSKWLRLFGYDTLYPGDADDAWLVDIAGKDDRILLTRDKEIALRRESKKITVVTVTSDDIEKQLDEVFSILKITPSPDRILTLCSVCNTQIIEIPKESVKGLIPNGVFELHDRFWKCPCCGRFYWMGTHWKKIIDRAVLHKLK
jgi:uncharacterized protein with PIN domain